MNNLILYFIAIIQSILLPIPITQMYYLKFSPPGEIIGTGAKNRSAPRWTLSRQTPPGADVFSAGGGFLGGDFIFSTPVADSVPLGPTQRMHECQSAWQWSRPWGRHEWRIAVSVCCRLMWLVGRGRQCTTVPVHGAPWMSAGTTWTGRAEGMIIILSALMLLVGWQEGHAIQLVKISRFETPCMKTKRQPANPHVPAEWLLNRVCKVQIIIMQLLQWCLLSHMW